MKVLFAINDENIVSEITSRYQQKYKEIITSKSVYYFNAILKELQNERDYDAIVIGEDLEPIADNNYDRIDRFILEKMDEVSDEASQQSGSDIPIILICSDRRTRNDPILAKLFSMSIYNAITGSDRTIEQVCELISKPRGKKEAKAYYNMNRTEEYDPITGEDVSESEIQSILNHYTKIAGNEQKCVESFEIIASQYNPKQLKIIVNFLPMSVKSILERHSARYQQLFLLNGKVNNNEKKQGSELLTVDISKGQKLEQPVVIPDTLSHPITEYNNSHINNNSGINGQYMNNGYNTGYINPYQTQQNPYYYQYNPGNPYYSQYNGQQYQHHPQQNFEQNRQMQRNSNAMGNQIPNQPSYKSVYQNNQQRQNYNQIHDENVNFQNVNTNTNVQNSNNGYIQQQNINNQNNNMQYSNNQNLQNNQGLYQSRIEHDQQQRTDRMNIEGQANSNQVYIQSNNINPSQIENNELNQQKEKKNLVPNTDNEIKQNTTTYQDIASVFETPVIPEPEPIPMEEIPKFELEDTNSETKKNEENLQNINNKEIRISNPIDIINDVEPVKNVRDIEPIKNDENQTNEIIKNKENEQEPKRGRGRPRKMQIEEIDEKPKRGRGRPRKIKIEDELDKTQTVIEQSPKSQSTKVEPLQIINQTAQAEAEIIKPSITIENPETIKPSIKIEQSPVIKPISTIEQPQLIQTPVIETKPAIHTIQNIEIEQPQEIETNTYNDNYEMPSPFGETIDSSKNYKQNEEKINIYDSSVFNDSQINYKTNNELKDIPNYDTSVDSIFGEQISPININTKTSENDIQQPININDILGNIPKTTTRNESNNENLNIEIKNENDGGFNSYNIPSPFTDELNESNSEETYENLINQSQEYENSYFPNNFQNSQFYNGEQMMAENMIPSSNIGAGKLCIFTGTSKNGVSFIVNNLAQMLIQSNIKVAILDETKNRNSFYIYTNNDEPLINKAISSIKNLENGIARGLDISRYLTVYTNIPDGGLENKTENIEAIISTLTNNYDIILVDSDFETDERFFAYASEIYIVQSMDTLTIQPMTKFLSELKDKGLLQEEKIRVIINKYMNMKRLPAEIVIEGLTRYNEPTMTLQKELFNSKNVPAILIPFDMQAYTRYMDVIATCQMSLNGYPTVFLNSLDKLASIIYGSASELTKTKNNTTTQRKKRGFLSGKLSGKKPKEEQRKEVQNNQYNQYNQFNPNQYLMNNNLYSNEMNDILNKMKRNY